MADLRPNSEIADGVHWLKNRFVNNYIIEDKGELILIDTAFNKKAEGIFEYIKAELSDQKVAKIYLTHHHGDHTGGARHLEQEFHPPIYVGKEDADVVKGERKPPLPNNIFLKPIFFILRPLTSAKPVESVQLLEDGMKMDNLEVYHLPGHTMGSMGFLKGSSMFSGDAAITDDGEIEPGTNIFAESKSIARQSLIKLGEIDMDMLLPGHGKPILHDADMRIKDAISSL